MKNLSAKLDLGKRDIPCKEEITSILRAAFDAADPVRAVEDNLDLDGDVLIAGNHQFSLPPGARVVTIALGKAAPAMLKGAVNCLGVRIQDGVCVYKHPQNNLSLLQGIKFIIGDHPVPGEGSIQAGKMIKETVTGLSSNDVVLLLLSGGGSSLASLPAEGITLFDLQESTAALLKSGATISEFNTVRKHLDLLKGGGLLRMAAPARVAALVLSDVVGNDLEVIASGPAYPDPSTYSRAQEILLRTEKFGRPIPGVIDHLNQGAAGKKPETVKPGDAEAKLGFNTIIGSNLNSCLAAVECAQTLGFHAEFLTDRLVGEARKVGEHQAEIAQAKSCLPRPFMLICGGETTVTVVGEGKGGRNQEVALGAVRGFAGLENLLLITLATDGEDGPTNAAGAFVDGSTLTRALARGLDPDEFLRRNDAYSFFESLDDLLVIGPTGTNVNDISLIFGF
ncbi:MAG: DUF4147 domain-containing protein [Anaerolineaceae bacterium]